MTSGLGGTTRVLLEGGRTTRRCVRHCAGAAAAVMRQSEAGARDWVATFGRGCPGCGATGPDLDPLWASVLNRASEARGLRESPPMWRDYASAALAILFSCLVIPVLAAFVWWDQRGRR